MKILHYISWSVLCVAIPLISMGCDRENISYDKPEESAKEFHKGADVSWLTEMESNGYSFADTHGNKKDCLELLKMYGIGAVRLRVWVDPDEHGNWCNATDVLAKAKRAKAQGMDVMIDFHYSDWWADAGKQNIPAAWDDHTFGEIGMDMAKHTYEVLKLLKKNGINPKWVQIGNETSNGMLWPVGKADLHPEQYARLFIAGHHTVKKVFPEAQVIVHLDRGDNEGLYHWNLDILKEYGAKWDIIGMSVYPYWSMKDGQYESVDEMMEQCAANMRRLSLKYDCEIMVVETGMECADSQGHVAAAEILEKSRQQLRKLVRLCKDPTTHCRGVFYWEPECRPSQYSMGAFTEEGKPTVIMDGFRE